jgi:hypothetical protein
MNLAALLALLLSSGLCAKTEFRGADGSMLDVVVCPVMQPAGGAPDAPPAPPPPAPPPPDQPT